MNHLEKRVIIIHESISKSFKSILDVKPVQSEFRLGFSTRTTIRDDVNVR